MKWYVLCFNKRYAYILPSSEHCYKSMEPKLRELVEYVYGPFDSEGEATQRMTYLGRIYQSPYNPIDFILQWCEQELVRRGWEYDVEVRFKKGKVRVYVVVIDGGERRTLSGPNGDFLVGESDLNTYVHTAAMLQAAADLHYHLSNWANWMETQEKEREPLGEIYFRRPAGS